MMEYNMVERERQRERDDYLLEEIGILGINEMSVEEK